LGQFFERMADNQMENRLLLPYKIGSELEPVGMIEVGLNQKVPNCEIYTVDGVNERGKTTILDDVSKDAECDIVKEPPKFFIPGLPFTWYDLLVKGQRIVGEEENFLSPDEHEKYLGDLMEQNKPLILEILENSGCEVDENVLLDMKFAKFWGFVFSRLVMKNDLLDRYGEKNEEKARNIVLSDRNAMTTLALNISDYVTKDNFDDNVFLEVLKIYSYLGKNNYIPVSKHTFVFTSQEGSKFVSNRGVGLDVNDKSREAQEIVYREILKRRGRPFVRELMDNFLGQVWHIEMTHLIPEGGWGDSIDSYIAGEVLKKLIENNGVMPDRIVFSPDFHGYHNLAKAGIFARDSDALHISGDFEVVPLGFGSIIKSTPTYLRLRNHYQPKLYWYVSSAHDSILFADPEVDRAWFESVLAQLCKDNFSIAPEATYVGNKGKAELLSIQKVFETPNENEMHFSGNMNLDGNWDWLFGKFWGVTHLNYSLQSAALLSLEHGRSKQYHADFEGVGVSNDIAPVFTLPLNVKREPPELMELRVNPNRPGLYSLDSTLKRKAWERVLPVIKGIGGFGEIVISNSTVTLPRSARINNPSLTLLFLYSGDTSGFVGTSALTLSTSFSLSPEANEKILGVMESLAEGDDWKLPFGMDLGDMVEQGLLISKEMLAHTLTHKEHHGFVHNEAVFNLDIFGLYLSRAGFFRDFGHGPISSLMAQLRKDES